MSENKKNRKLLKTTILSTLSLATALPIVIAPIVKLISNSGIKSNSTSSKNGLDSARDGNALYLGRKNNFQLTSSKNGYFEFASETVIKFYNYDGEEQWSYDVTSNTDMVTYPNGEKYSKGSYANPKATLLNPIASRDTKIYDACFNDDATKIVVLSGIKDSNDIVKLNVFQINVVSGLPYVNNINSPNPVYNKGCTDSTNGGNIIQFQYNIDKPHAFLSVNNGKAIVMVQRSDEWAQNYKLDLNTYISTPYTFPNSNTTDGNLKSWFPFSFSKLPNGNSILFLTKGPKFGWQQLDKNYKPTGDFVSLSNSFPDLSLEVDVNVMPCIPISKDGNSLYLYLKRDRNGTLNKLVKYPINNNQSQAELSFLSSPISNINWRTETNTIVVSNSQGLQVIDMNSLQQKTITYPNSLSSGNFANARIRTINSNFNKGDYSNGSGCTIIVGNTKYFLKMKSDFSSNVIEKIVPNVRKNSNELLKTNDARFKLTKALKFKDLIPILGFQEEPNQEPSTPDKLTLLDESGNAIEDSDTSDQTILQYYPNEVSNTNTIKFAYTITKESWWSTNDTIVYFTSVDSNVLSGFSESSDFYITEKEGASWNGKKFLASRINLQTVINNLTFGVSGKANYDATVDIIEPTIENGDAPTGDLDKVPMASGKYIKLYANDDTGSLSILYNFSKKPGFNITESKLPYSAVVGLIIVNGFQTNSDYQVFYPTKEAVKKLLDSYYSFNIDKDIIMNIIPIDISSGYSMDKEYWHWQSYNDISTPEGLINIWNNYLTGILTYNGPLGNDRIDSILERRIFIIPQEPPKAGPDGNYSVVVNGQIYTGKLYDPLTNNGDIFFNSKELVSDGTGVSVIKKISGDVPGTIIDKLKLDAFAKKAINTNEVKIKNVIKNNISNEDIDAYQLDPTSYKASLIRSYLFEYIESSNSEVLGGENSTAWYYMESNNNHTPAIAIHDNWIDSSKVKLSFTDKQPSSENKYYLKYKMSISVPLDAETKIIYNNQNLTIEKLGLVNPDNPKKSIFDTKEGKEIEVEVLDYSKVYETLELQPELKEKNLGLLRTEDGFFTDINVFDVGYNFAKDNTIISPNHYIQNVESSNDTFNQIAFAEKINNYFKFLNGESKYKDTNAYQAYTLQSVRLSGNDYDGVVSLIFEVCFNNPSTGKPLAKSVGTKFITLNISGFCSYRYELIMWIIFSIVLAIVIILLALLIITLRKERNKKRLWNTK